MKNIELADLRNHEYMLRHIIAHMHYWREGSNWIVQEGGRSNTAVMALLSVGADYLDVGTHELLASACPGDLVITPLHMRYEFRVHSAVDSMSSISHLPNSSFYYNGMKHEVFSEGQLANAIFIGFEMQDHQNEPLTVGRHIEVLRFKESDDLLKRIEYIARAAGSGFFPPALIAAKTYELLTSLSDRAHNLTLRTTAYRRIEPALRYIDNHPIGSTSVSALSEQCCLLWCPLKCSSHGNVYRDVSRPGKTKAMQISWINRSIMEKCPVNMNKSHLVFFNRIISTPRRKRNVAVRHFISQFI